MKIYIKSLTFLSICFLLCSCDNDDLDDAAPGDSFIQLNIFAKGEKQDSIKGVFLKFNQIHFSGANGNIAIDMPSYTEQYNLLDLNAEEPVQILQRITPGQYDKLGIDVKLLSEDRPEKVALCHVPPGNPGNAQSLNIGHCAVRAHTRNHDDYLGPCLSDVNTRNRGYSYLQMEQNNSVELLYGSQEVFEQDLAFNISAGSTLTANLIIDLDASLTYSDSSKIDDCYKLIFRPVVEIEVLSGKTGIAGSYTEVMLPAREYMAYVYESGTYTSSEASPANPFRNALNSTEIKEDGSFSFELQAGRYHIIIAEFQRGRFRSILDDLDGLELKAGEFLQKQF